MAEVEATKRRYAIAKQVITDWHDYEKWHDPSMMPIPPFSGAQEEELTRLISDALKNEADASEKKIAALTEALRGASVLVSLVTVRQVINAGDKYINAAGLNPYCINEGLATGDEHLDPAFIEIALAEEE